MESKLVPSAMLSPTRSVRPLFRQVRIDLVLYALILALFGTVFYIHWNLWEDQAAQVYMTWGMFHGLRPYVALVDPNWPGILLPHTIAYLMAGVNGWGIRLLDLLFLYTLLSATSLVLAAWNTSTSIRLFCGLAFTTHYFATGWQWTAERESFCWPLFVVSAVPFLLTLGPRKLAQSDAWNFRPAVWMLSGCLAGVSLWIKPAPWTSLAILSAMSVFLSRKSERPRMIRATLWYFGGVVIVTLLTIALLAIYGMLAGFIKWGIYYDLGPYSQVKFPWPQRLQMVFEFMTAPLARPIPLALCLIGCVFPLMPNRFRSPDSYVRPIATAFALFIAGLANVLLQGKPGSVYHFIPMDWSLALLAAVLWSQLRWSQSMANLAYAGSAMIAALTLAIEPTSPGPTTGTVSAHFLKRVLGPNDQIVEWGYSPTLLVSLQRPTPFMTFIGSAFMVTSPPGSWAAREVMDRLNTAIQDPRVKFLLVSTAPNYKIQENIASFPAGFIEADQAVSETIRQQYTPLPPDALYGFEVFQHNRRPVATSPTNTQSF